MKEIRIKYLGNSQLIRIVKNEKSCSEVSTKGVAEQLIRTLL